MRFSVNVSILFTEVPLLERFGRARDAGFDTVEMWWPRGEDPAAVVSAVKDAGVDVALLNFDAGDMPAGERGLLSDPSRQDEFRSNVPVALDMAKQLDCKMLNALAGHRIDGMSHEEQEGVARENVRFAADAAADQGANVLIEAVNTFENGPYLFFRTKDAADFVESVERDNVWLQYDVYHMQRMEGNLAATMEQHWNRIMHIQIADSPSRNQPGTGEINYDYIFRRIEELGYSGYVGLEYKPPEGGDTESSLEWLPRDRRAAREKA